MELFQTLVVGLTLFSMINPGYTLDLSDNSYKQLVKDILSEVIPDVPGSRTPKQEARNTSVQVNEIFPEILYSRFLEAPTQKAAASNRKSTAKLVEALGRCIQEDSR